ncbi:MAG: hypothetical protein DRN08_05665, partial [Thermoplasmata archaeon]
KFDDLKNSTYLKLDRYDQLLVEMLRSVVNDELINKINSYSSEEWSQLLDRSMMNGVTALLWNNLKSFKHLVNIPAEIADKMTDSLVQSTGRGIIIHNQLKELLTNFSENNIQVIILKGAHLAEEIYKNLYVRQMFDIDILVKKHDLPRLNRSLREIGYKPIFVDGTNPKIESQFPYSPPKSGVRLELHTSLKSTVMTGFLDEEALWARARTLSIDGIETLVLAPEDLLLHLCYHISYHLYRHFGLRTLCDISEVIHFHNNKINWNQIVDCADNRHIKKNIFSTLLPTKIWLNDNIPDDVLNELTPRDFNPEIMKWIKSQIFDGRGQYYIRSTKIPELVSSEKLANKIVIILRGIIPSKGQIARKYGIKSNSVRVYLYYLLHIMDMVRRHYRTMIKLLKNDEVVVNIAKKEYEREREKNALREWFIRE